MVTGSSVNNSVIHLDDRPGFSQETAAKLDREIEQHLNTAANELIMARNKLWLMREHEGWKMLGYSSFKAYYTGRFMQKKAQIYRQLNAAEIEAAVEVPVGTLPERALRPFRGLPEADRKTAFGLAASVVGGADKITAGVAEETVEFLRDAVLTGHIEDGQGIQHPIMAALELGLRERLEELRERQALHRRGEKQRVYLARNQELIVNESGKGWVGLGDIVLEPDCELKFSPGVKVRATIWVDLAD
jgi:hypothetical protein